MNLDLTHGWVLAVALLGCSSSDCSHVDRGSSGASGAAGVAALSGAGGHGGQAAASRGGASGDAQPIAGSSGGRGGGSGGDAAASDRCSDAALTWKSGSKTTYTSYPEPGSDECIEFSGCQYEGQFAACDGVKSEAWVSQHNVVAFFPDFSSHQLHDLCLRERDGSNAIVVTVYDTCGDNDCDGCCTQNRGSADALIDVESYTDQRWGVPDGRIEWADLGATSGQGCDGK
jgi:hypothetical protein